MDEKLLFVADYVRGQAGLAALCRRYGVSRKTGYKWVERYRQEGTAGLEERSRRPHRQPTQLPYEVRKAIVELRGRGPSDWGPKKIQALLAQRYPGLEIPCRTTIYKVLKQAGLVASRRQRRRTLPGAQPLREARAPNLLWSADFKGQFLLGNGQWCYPLTVMDHASRYLLGCQGLPGTQQAGARSVFEKLFRDYGLPERIRTDNGVPFASVGAGGLSKLSIWWIRLGIQPERIAPGRPEQNGRHERMHRTLKRAVTRPAASSANGQQRRFAEFRCQYNEQRPHEALDQRTPASVYVASSRPFPERLPEMTYPPYLHAHRVCDSGLVYWRAQRIYIGHLLAGEHVGLEAIDDGVWRAWFGSAPLGIFDERDLKHGDNYLSLKSVTHVCEHFCYPCP